MKLILLWRNFLSAALWLKSRPMRCVKSVHIFNVNLASQIQLLSQLKLLASKNLRVKLQHFLSSMVSLLGTFSRFLLCQSVWCYWLRMSVPRRFSFSATNQCLMLKNHISESYLLSYLCGRSPSQWWAFFAQVMFTTSLAESGRCLHHSQWHHFSYSWFLTRHHTSAFSFWWEYFSRYV